MPGTNLKRMPRTLGLASGTEVQGSYTQTIRKVSVVSATVRSCWVTEWAFKSEAGTMGTWYNSEDHPSLRIVITSILVGGVAGIAGVIVSLLVWPSNNLAPLFGIFITGPIGLFAGALIGIVESVRNSSRRSVSVELGWLGFLWGFSLLNMFLAPAVGTEWLSVALQGLVITTGTFLLINQTARGALSDQARALGPMFLLAAILCLILSIFVAVGRSLGLQS